MNLLEKDETNLKQKAKEIEYLSVSLYNRMVCIYTLLGILTPPLTSWAEPQFWGGFKCKPFSCL
jgi:hypothetical protein